MQIYEFEKLTLQPTTTSEDFQVNAIVEQEQGTTVRTVWDEKAHVFVTTSMIMPVPLPLPYGWIPQTLCEGDGDALDVLILTRSSIPQGHFLAVRPIGVLLRQDLDHKVLGVDVQDVDFGKFHNYLELPTKTLNSIEDWFRPYFALTGWLDATGAKNMILQSHQLFLQK